MQVGGGSKVGDRSGGSSSGGVGGDCGGYVGDGVGRCIGCVDGGGGCVVCVGGISKLGLSGDVGVGDRDDGGGDCKGEVERVQGQRPRKGKTKFEGREEQEEKRERQCGIEVQGRKVGDELRKGVERQGQGVKQVERFGEEGQMLEEGQNILRKHGFINMIRFNCVFEH